MSEDARRIGAGSAGFVRDARPSAEWFPQLVRPADFLDYWLDVPTRYWPELGAHWLGAGHDSGPLRALARRTPGELVTTDEMLDVLRSLGVDTESVASFLARCERAVRRIQPDLDATGFGRYRMTAANAARGDDNLPAVYAAIPGRGWWSSGAAMTMGMDDDELLDTAAESVSDTLVEVDHVVWPSCPEHSGPPLTLRSGAWFCARGDHGVAALGELRG